MITDLHKQIISQMAKIHARSIFKDHKKQEPKDQYPVRSVEERSVIDNHDFLHLKTNSLLTK